MIFFKQRPVGFIITVGQEYKRRIEIYYKTQNGTKKLLVPFCVLLVEILNFYKFCRVLYIFGVSIGEGVILPLNIIRKTGG